MQEPKREGAGLPWLQETRCRIIRRLVHRGPATSIELAERLGCTRQNVHHHLRVLEDLGLVEAASGRSRWRARVDAARDDPGDRAEALSRSRP